MRSEYHMYIATQLQKMAEGGNFVHIMYHNYDHTICLMRIVIVPGLQLGSKLMYINCIMCL